jgi:glycosyltransferase involved in cell wall biosynthesis
LFSYKPNLDGIHWFLRECWPGIKREIPGARLRLVGKDSDGLLQPTAAGVDCLGWIADPSEEIATWSAMIIPVRFGAGTRVKVAEAFGRKCPLISTRLGAFGYDVADGRELLLADSPEAFSAACVQLIRDPSAATAMAARAWRLFLDKWTWDAIRPRVWAAAEHCLRLDGNASDQRLPGSAASEFGSKNRTHSNRTQLELQSDEQIDRIKE